MNIAWYYLDKRMATINVLRDHPAMLDTLSDFNTDALEAEAKLESIKTSSFDSMPSAHDPQAGENRIIQLIQNKDVQNARYQQAMEYMNWFNPAWNKLNVEDQIVLREFFWNNEDMAEAAESVCKKLGFERATAYRRKNEALSRLSFFLYGK